MSVQRSGDRRRRAIAAGASCRAGGAPVRHRAPPPRDARLHRHRRRSPASATRSSTSSRSASGSHARRREQARSRRRRELSRVRRPRAARQRRRHRRQRGVHLPDHARLQVEPDLHRRTRPPIRPTQIVDGVIYLRHHPDDGDLVRSSCSCCSSAPCRRRSACSGSSRDSLGGLAFGTVIMAYTLDDRGGHGAARDDAALRHPADVPVLRHLLPAPAAARSTCSGSAGSRRSGTPPSSVASSRTATPSPSGSPSCMSLYLVALVVVGWAWSRRIAVRRLNS